MKARLASLAAVAALVLALVGAQPVGATTPPLWRCTETVATTPPIVAAFTTGVNLTPYSHPPVAWSCVQLP